MNRYERLEELRKEVAQLQMEIMELEQELYQECNEHWFKLQKQINEQIAKRPPLEVRY